MNDFFEPIAYILLVLGVMQVIGMVVRWGFARWRKLEELLDDRVREGLAADYERYRRLQIATLAEKDAFAQRREARRVKKELDAHPEAVDRIYEDAMTAMLIYRSDG